LEKGITRHIKALGLGSALLAAGNWLPSIGKWLNQTPIIAQTSSEILSMMPAIIRNSSAAVGKCLTNVATSPWTTPALLLGASVITYTHTSNYCDTIVAPPSDEAKAAFKTHKQAKATLKQAAERTRQQERQALTDLNLASAKERDCNATLSKAQNLEIEMQKKLKMAQEETIKLTAQVENLKEMEIQAMAKYTDAFVEEEVDCPKKFSQKLITLRGQERALVNTLQKAHEKETKLAARITKIETTKKQELQSLRKMKNDSEASLEKAPTKHQRRIRYDIAELATKIQRLEEELSTL
jgi:acylphosphatase